MRFDCNAEFNNEKASISNKNKDNSFLNCLYLNELKFFAPIGRCYETFTFRSYF